LASTTQSVEHEHMQNGSQSIAAIGHQKGMQIQQTMITQKNKNSTGKNNNSEIMNNTRKQQEDISSMNKTETVKNTLQKIAIDLLAIKELHKT